jgi:hypothetical protein
VIGGVFYFLTSYRAEKEKTEGKKPRIGLRRKNGRKKIEGLHGEKPKETKGTKTAWGKTEGNQRNKTGREIRRNHNASTERKKQKDCMGKGEGNRRNKTRRENLNGEKKQKRQTKRRKT